MATNNNGHLLDSAGNVAVDFVWGNLPMQPNDERAATVSNYGGSTGDHSWGATTMVASGRLDFTADSHAIAEAVYSGFPSYIAGVAVYHITAASGDGTTVTYTGTNEFKAGDVITIQGLSVSALNLSSVTVASANAQQFTVTNAATGSVTAATGLAYLANAATYSSGYYVNGVPYLAVPNVIGKTTALAEDALLDAGYLLANITVATAATNATETVTAASRTAGQVATTITATNTYAAGDLVTISGVDTTVNGTWTVVSATGSAFVIDTTATTALSLSALTGSVVAVSGTIHTQSVAAGAASQTTSSLITITPWA